jgi:6-phosphogluconate dehydrogenase
MKHKLRIGMIGLGRMGANMARRLARGGAEVLAWSRSAGTRRALAREPRVAAVADLASMVEKLAAPRVLWLMLPAGKPTEDTLATLAPLLARGDVVVNGANAYYKDSMRQAAELAGHGLYLVDAGVSGGIWGLANGYAVMLGGDVKAVKRLTPFVKLLAPPKGWLHCGPSGAGHYVKMIHNGIEYGMMQAYAEGFALLAGKREFGLDLAAVAELWRHGSVVRSWLLDLMADNFKRDPALEGIAPVVADSGEGRWTAIEAVELGVPAPVISLALAMRFASQGRGDYGARLLAQLRNSFGGHAVTESGHPSPVGSARGGHGASKKKKS